MCCHFEAQSKQNERGILRISTEEIFLSNDCLTKDKERGQNHMQLVRFSIISRGSSRVLCLQTIHYLNPS